jgi:hypothetical protein
VQENAQNGFIMFPKLAIMKDYLINMAEALSLFYP